MKKNLLFVFADQWRGDAIGCAHADPVITPNMDAFSREATYCDHAFSTFPLCTAHRASLMTGRYPLSMGIFTNCKTGLAMRLPDEEIGVGQMLQSAGYQTGYIGKWHLDEPEVNHNPHPESGASEWDAFTPPGIRRHGFEYWLSYGTYDYHMHPHYWHDTPKAIRPEEWSVAYETDRAIDYIRNIRDKNKPFALYVSWNPPHSIYEEVPQKYLELYPSVTWKANVSLKNLHHHTGEKASCTTKEFNQMLRQYYAAVSGLDDNFGRLITCLKEEGLYDDTVVVLSADHGNMMGSHSLMGKHVWYEESIRIPLIIRVPGNQKRICRTCIGSVDQTPTVLGLLGVSIPDSVEGRDLSCFLLDDREDLEHSSFLCACPGRKVFLDAFKKAEKDPKDFGWRGIRTQDFTYVMELGYDVVPKPARYLYCTAADPQQMHPLLLEIPENKRIAKHLEKQVLRWMESQKDGFLGNWESAAGIWI